MATPPKLCGDCGTQMEVMPDLYALPGFDKTEAGFQFNTNRAVPITVYICPNCGRFKFMSALMLGNLETAEVVGGAQQQGGAQQGGTQQGGAQQGGSQQSQDGVAGRPTASENQAAAVPTEAV